MSPVDSPRVPPGSYGFPSSPVDSPRVPRGSRGFPSSPVDFLESHEFPWIPLESRGFQSTGFQQDWDSCGLRQDSSPVQFPKNVESTIQINGIGSPLGSTGIPKNPQESSGIQWIYVGDSKDLEISRLTHEEISADLQKLTQELTCMSPDQELDLLTKLRLCLRDILESSLGNIADPIDACSGQPTNKSTKISDSPICSDSDSTTEFITDADMWYADLLGLSLTKSTAHTYEDDSNNNEEREHLKECPSPSNNSLSTPSEVPISTLPQMETVNLDHHRHASLAV